MADLLDEIIDGQGLEGEVREAGEGVFTVQLRSPHGALTRTLSAEKPPGLRAVLLYLAERAQAVFECEDLADWADDEGCDPDDAEAAQRYEGLRCDEADLRVLLGRDGFLRLIGGLAVAQAIGAARSGLNQQG